MSIVPLNKVTVFGLGVDKAPVLEGLQRLGCMHLIPLQPPPQTSEFAAPDASEEARQALRYIMDVPRRRHQVHNEAEFDLERVVAEALANKQKRREADDKRIALTNRLQNLAPWGNFTLPNLDDLGGYRLWFYQVPYAKAKHLQKLELPWQAVYQDHRYLYVVVIAKEEPPSDLLPVSRTRAGSVSPEELQRQLEGVQIELDEIESEHEALSRWIFLLSKNIARAEDEVALKQADSQAAEEEGIFMVQGWMPQRQLKQLDAFTQEQGLAFLAEPPQADEKPPTLMENPPNLSGGQDLVSFYQTPGYRNWDPSIVVFFSFALFFAMILADAGYTLILLGILAYFWKQMGQTAGGRHFRFLGVVILAASLIYGIMVGSYFGLTPPDGSLLYGLKVLSVNDVDTMMKLSISIGCLHVGLANGIVAYRAGLGNLVSSAQPLGWIVAICGGLTLYLGFWHNLGTFLLIGGFFLVFLGGFLSSQQKLPWRLLGGFSSLTGISGLFGDILSYLRLFALGLASGSLALTFNTMAKQVVASAAGEPGVQYLFAFIILLVGHGINFTLTIVSCFVHGLRLNFIEFFKWGIADEGYPFQAFAKKEIET